MRTTIDLDDDVLMAIKERARREKRSAGQVLSELARQALTGQARSPSQLAVDAFHGFQPLAHRGPPVSNALIDRLREEDLD